jgi:hypothetical protein
MSIFLFATYSNRQYSVCGNQDRARKSNDERIDERYCLNDVRGSCMMRRRAYTRHARLGPLWVVELHRQYRRILGSNPGCLQLGMIDFQGEVRPSATIILHGDYASDCT